VPTVPATTEPTASGTDARNKAAVLYIVRALADRLGVDVRLHDGKNGTGLLAVVHFPGTAANAGPRAETERIGRIGRAG